MIASIARRVLACVVLAACLVALPACAAPAASEDAARPADPPEAPSNVREDRVETEEEDAAVPAMTLTIEGRAFALALEDNEAARAFAALMPLELDMRDVNGNEKFAELNAPLPADERAPGRVEAGDVMLYGDDGVVVFYESFDTPYSYPRLGRVDDPAAVEALSGSPSVRVAFGA